MSRKLDKLIAKARQDKDRIDKEYAATLKAMRVSHASSEEIAREEGSWSGEQQVGEFELDALLTRKLMGKAEKFDVPLPHRPVYSNEDPDWDHNKHWYRSPIDGSYLLTQRGRDYLEDAIWKTEERKYNRWTRWVTLGIGLFGTLTGLLSVTAANWEKFAALASRIRSLL